MPQAYKQLVDGQWETGTETISVIDKYSGEEIGTVPSASKDDVARAVGAVLPHSGRRGRRHLPVQFPAQPGRA